MILRPGALLSRGGSRANMQTIATNLGLTPALALDAGDAASYTSGQTWTDLSGNARHVVRGANDTPSTDDPTFNGTPGQLSRNEYWSFDGGDFFTKSTANGTFINGLHKDNAVFSWCCMVRTPASFANGVLFSTFGSSGASTGVQVLWNGGGNLQFTQGNGSSNVAVKVSTAAASASAWTFLGLSVNEAGGAAASFMQVNDTVETFDGAYTTPSASDAAGIFTIGARTGVSAFLGDGTRMIPFALFATTMTQAQMAAIHHLLRGRVGA